MFVSFYKCENCDRIYVKYAGQLIHCPFCDSKERELLGDVQAVDFIHQVTDKMSESELRATIEIVQRDFES